MRLEPRLVALLACLAATMTDAAPSRPGAEHVPGIERLAGAARPAGAVRLPGAELRPVGYAALDGWAADAHAAAFAAFRRSCASVATDGVAGGLLKDAVAADLAAACRRAEALGPDPDDDASRRFFEEAFVPWRVAPEAGRGFVTAYFEPEIDGALAPSAEFSAPLYAPPADLVSFAGVPPEGAPAGITAAQRTSAGLRPYPTRAEIDSGLLDGRGLEIVWLKSPIDAFIAHVQGSAHVRLAEGGTLRLSYAAKNGQPYTSIGRVLIERGEIPREAMTLARLTAWLETHPREAAQVMHRNKSYVFFEVNQDLDPALGPRGAQGVQLTAGRSAAVDKALHAYGLPVWVDARLPSAPGAAEVPFRRLMIAQDTGTAIVGPARLDLFLGSGEAAGRLAGEIRHEADVVLLLPRPGLAAEP
jgi:membrane-bound lytic murein transglycosylase A